MGGRGDSGRPARGDMGMLLSALFGARGIGEFIGLSPGRGLMGRPGLISGGAVTFRCKTPAASEIARCLKIAAGSAVGSKDLCPPSGAL